MNPLLDGIRAVFFDAVGTLIVPDPPFVEAYASCAERQGLKISRAAIEARFREAFRSEEEEDRVLGWGSSENRELRRWRTIVRTVFHGTGNEVQIHACFDALFAHFAQPTAWRTFDFAGRVLANLAKRGLILGVASNFDHRLNSVIDGLPELSPLRIRIISSEIGLRKPHPSFFTEVIRRAGRDAREILFVGDSRESDYDPASAAGLLAV